MQKCILRKSQIKYNVHTCSKNGLKLVWTKVKMWSNLTSLDRIIRAVLNRKYTITIMFESRAFSAQSVYYFFILHGCYFQYCYWKCLLWMTGEIVTIWSRVRLRFAKTNERLIVTTMSYRCPFQRSEFLHCDLNHDYITRFILQT